MGASNPAQWMCARRIGWRVQWKMSVCDRWKERFDTMGSVKDTVRSLLERLPDDITMEDVRYHLYVLETAQRGSTAPRMRAR